MKKDVQTAIKDAAKLLIDRYSENFQFLGIYEKKEVYMYLFPDYVQTGFPFVYLYDKDTNIAEGRTGFDASNIINSLLNKQ